MKYDGCESCGKWSPRLSVVGNASAAVFKFIIGMLSGSMGLVADSLHSSADAFSSLLILAALKIASKPKDEGHPYGHGKVEYISTIFASIFIFTGATLILIEVLHTIKSGGIHKVPDTIAIFATIISLFFSYLMYQSNHCAGTQLCSPALLADAGESKADALASIAVLVGLIGTKVGYVYADTIAAGAVAVLVFHISVEMFLKGVDGLIDVSLDKDILKKIQILAQRVNGVEGVRDIKSRCMGQKCCVDLSINVLKTETILNSYQIAEAVKAIIKEKVEGIDEVTVRTLPISKWRFVK
ncbi:MAG: cation transporter [Nitrospirae bacterium]|nr:cation transporter [Nitrospirota bacterium]MBF0541088.1 cation transporter [Nitrospirota bacterium]